ncbi:MAG: LuxR C-terminal-related transcriptional regulator [Candidatus Acidiferrum sp.]
MVSLAAQINQAPAVPAVTTPAASKVQEPVPAQAAPVTVPQDTVTISPQAQSIVASAAPSIGSNLPVSSVSNIRPSSVATVSVQVQVQQMASQGLSANQIASNLNVSVSTVDLYLTTASPVGASSAAPALAASNRILY